MANFQHPLPSNRQSSEVSDSYSYFLPSLDISTELLVQLPPEDFRIALQTICGGLPSPLAEPSPVVHPVLTGTTLRASTPPSTPPPYGIVDDKPISQGANAAVMCDCGGLATVSCLHLAFCNIGRYQSIEKLTSARNRRASMNFEQPRPVHSYHHLLPLASPSGVSPEPDPIPDRPQHPFNASAQKAQVVYYCAHEDGRQCKMNARFRTKRSIFEEHLRSVTHNYRHHCPHCGLGTNRSYNLTRHFKTCRVLNPEPGNKASDASKHSVGAARRCRSSSTATLSPYSPPLRPSRPL
ncbi:hypothetical protein FRB94_002322 [Tulasnella sp. JGI-2019a]|nr:hypothetical protein FRB94_002322 [Tulasnella sp. JGI-2019a]